MTNITNTPDNFECQVRSIDEHGRSGGVWITVSSGEALGQAKASGLAQLEKQREDASRLQFQILNALGEVVATLDPLRKEWVMNTSEQDYPVNQFVSHEQLERVRKVAGMAFSMAFTAIGGMIFMGILFALNR